MEDETLKPCIACAEEIKQDAVLCRFCQTRQDNAEFRKVEPRAAGLEESWAHTPGTLKLGRSGIWGLSATASIALLVTAGVAIFAIVVSGFVATSRGSMAAEIEKTVTQEVYKLNSLNLMGPLETVKCNPQGISIVLPVTTYKCFAQDASGKGLVFIADMDWAAGVYQYALDKN